MPAVARAVKTKANPQNDPRFKRVVDKLNNDSRKLKQHPPAAKKAAEPAKAAKPPANEKAAGARTKQVEKLDQAETKKPETSSFLALLQAEIAKAMPKTLGDTEKFMKGGSSEQMKGSLKGNVAQQKQEATGDLKKTSNETPSESGVPAKQVTPIAPEPVTAAPQLDAAGAMPVPKPDAEVSLQASKSEVVDETKKNKIDDLNKKTWQTDSRYSTMLAAKDSVAKQADTAPAQYRAKEVGTLAQTAAKAVDVTKKGAATLLGVKGGNKAKVLSRQEQQKVKEEEELKRFTDLVVKIFADTKTVVDNRLEQLETKVNKLFDQGIEAALSAMKSYVEDQILKYKLKRYLLNPLGSLLWIKDQILELPEEVNRFYEQGRSQFTTAINALAVRVANLVETELAAAKNDVKIGQAKIASESSKLSPGVKTRAAQVQADYAGKFAELESSIDDKKQQLAEGLAQKYKEAFDKMEEAQQAIRDDNKSLLTQAKEKIGEVVKALSEFKDRLMGILRKGADTIDLILKDPVQFLSNLLAAIKLGFNQFAGNIWTHLKAGFMKWLFGSLAKAGIEIPTDLTLPSILKLVLGVLGITYERMRAKAVKLIGERAVKAIEKVVEYVTVLVKGGPAALWEKVKEDLSSLKAMVIDAIQDWIITTIVKKAVAKVVSMFNPAGAVFQAIMLIYDVVSFVIDKASQIMDFVEAVINSVHAIATGAIGGAANWIEKSLANMIPILIGFLASLIGLGGISEKIKGFIKKVQDKVDGAIDKVIAKIVDVVKKLFGKGKDKANDPEKDKKIAAAEQALDVVTAKYPNGASDKQKLSNDVVTVKSQHPVFKTLSIIEHEEGFDYEYTVNPKKKKKGPVYGENWTVAPHVAKAPPNVTEAGQSHHVPAKVLKQWFAEVLEAAADNLPGKGHLRTLAATYRADPEGDKLSAIWLSEKDHKTAHKPAKPANLSIIKAELKNATLEIKTSSDNFSAKPMLPTLTRSVHAKEVGTIAPTTDKRMKELVVKKHNKLGAIFRSGFDSLLGAGIAFVGRAKLKKGKSKRDWKSALRSLALSTWSKLFRVPKS